MTRPKPPAADESDLGPYPLPDNAPIEDWPLNGRKLEVIQREGGNPFMEYSVPEASPK